MAKQLYRSRKNKIIGGVAGGLAEYFDIDPVLARALFVILFFGYGVGFLAYLVLWIIVPQRKKVYVNNAESVFIEEEEDMEENEHCNESNSKSKTFFGGVLILLGFVFMLDRFLPSFDLGDFWPLSLIIIGSYILYKNFRNKDTGDKNEN